MAVNRIKSRRKGTYMEKIGAIEYIDIRVFAHATEDQTKVEAATKNILPAFLREGILFKKTSLTGHHSNPIVMIETRFKDRKLLPEAMQKFGANLSSLDKEQLSQDLHLHLDKGNLYLRFDKQAAYQGILKLTQNDPIHVKIHFTK